jgi:hypothetical protein
MECFSAPIYITKGEALRMLGLKRASKLSQLGLKPIAVAKGVGCEYHLFSYSDIMGKDHKCDVR